MRIPTYPRQGHRIMVLVFVLEPRKAYHLATGAARSRSASAISEHDYFGPSTTWPDRMSDVTRVVFGVFAVASWGSFESRK